MAVLPGGGSQRLSCHANVANRLLCTSARTRMSVAALDHGERRRCVSRARPAGGSRGGKEHLARRSTAACGARRSGAACGLGGPEGHPDRRPLGGSGAADGRRGRTERRSRLRHALGKEAIETRAGGYSLCAEPGVVDARRFERLVHDARPLPPVERSAALRDVFPLWRGSPFADLSYESFLQGEIARLDELRLRRSRIASRPRSSSAGTTT